MSDLTRDSLQTSQLAVRLFLVDEKNGDPVAGVLVSIFRDARSTQNPSTIDHSHSETARTGTQSEPLATLQTDQAGYVSFKFDRSIAATTSRLMITRAGSR